MKKTVFWIVVLAVAVAAGIYFWPSTPVRRPPETPQVHTLPVPEPPPEAPVHPITEQAPEPEKVEPRIDLDRPLPALEEADPRMAEILKELFPGRNLGRYFILRNFIERFVVMVDNLPRRQLPRSHIPVKAVKGPFLTTGQDDYLVIDPANYRRYTPYVGLAEAVDTRLAVAAYTYLYPLFQQAYEGLGYSHGYFNDRLVEVIDHLLATPKVTDPVRLVQPKVLYSYADPQLEELSAGQKILIRTGPVNAERIKGVLRELRRELTGQVPGE